MDVWGITLATLRRWYVFLPIVAASVLLALSVGRGADPEYTATGSIMLTPPRVGSPIANPFVNAQGASEALVIILNGPETKARLADEGLNGAVTVSSGSRSSVLTMRSTSNTPEDAIALVDAVIDIASDELLVRQRSAGIESESLIGLQILAAPSITSVANDTALRVQAVIVAIGMVAGVTLAVLFDDIVGLIKRRRQSRPERPKHKRGSSLDETEPGQADLERPVSGLDDEFVDDEVSASESDGEDAEDIQPESTPSVAAEPTEDSSDADEEVSPHDAESVGELTSEAHEATTQRRSMPRTVRRRPSS